MTDETKFNGWTPKIIINTPKQAPMQVDENGDTLRQMFGDTKKNQLDKKTKAKMMEYIKSNSTKSLKELIKKFYKK